MAVSIPKMVVLTNRSLSRLYYGMMLVTGFGMAFWFIASGNYLSSVSLSETVHLNMWVNEPTDEALSATVAARMGDVCGNPSDYDYWYDDYWQYNGSECARVSSTCNPYQDMCVRTRDMYSKETPQQLFFTTFLKDKLNLVTGGSVERRRFFVPQVNAFTVNFEYFFTAPHLTTYSLGSPSVGASADEGVRLTNRDVMTVFLDAQGDVAWVAAPGESLNITVPTFLRLAGYPDHLTTPHASWGQNAFPGAANPEGPIGLIGGLPLELAIHCYKKPSRDLGEGYRHWTGPTCFVAVNGQEIWSTKYVTHFTGAEGVYDIDMSGIRITGEMDGTWEYFDVNNCILNFTALLVLLRIPKSILIHFTTRALGHVSTIYRKAIFQRFAIPQQVAGMAARMISHGASFREMEHDDKHGGLTKSNLYDTFAHVSRFRMKREAHPEEATIFEGRPSHAKATVEGDDVMLFTDFAFDAISNPGKSDATWYERLLYRSRCWKATQALVEAVLGNDFLAVEDERDTRRNKDGSRISVDHFLSAAVSSEMVDLEDLMWLFNKQRRIGFVERWFMPRVLRNQLIGPKTPAAAPSRAGEDVPAPRREKGEIDLYDQVMDLASDCTQSNRAILNSVAHSGRELRNELQRECTRLSEEVRLVQDACKRLAGERTRLNEEMRVIQEAWERLAERIERHNPLAPTAERIERRNPPVPEAHAPVDDDPSRFDVSVSAGFPDAVAAPEHRGPTPTAELAREHSGHGSTAQASHRSMRTAGRNIDEKHMRRFLNSFSGSLSARQASRSHMQ